MEISQDSGYMAQSSLFESTPNTTNPSRKRKHSLHKPSLSIPQSPIPILSSTLNESSITRSFENCNISSFYTPNFYIERTASIPDQGTPTKTFFKNHNQSQRTPPKQYSYQKLGSPERNKILYAEIKPNSVQKILHGIQKRSSSPAKKRLFAELHLKRLTHIDPVFYFTKLRNHQEVIEKILGYLNDADLCSFKNVSRDWRDVVVSDRKANLRVNKYLGLKDINKENLIATQGFTKNLLSPAQTHSCDFYEIAKTLPKDQHLVKCPRCNNASIVDKNIGQCQHFSCGYIYCLLCNSCSITGPENFTDRCMQSILQTGSPKKQDVPSFFLDSSSHNDTSGYSTSGELTPPLRTSLEPGRILSDCNRELPGVRIGGSTRRNSYVPVVAMSTKLVEIIEPSSPPKIKNVACSSRSKKNLRRLFR